MKTPAMTFAYSATPGGMVDQLKEVYADVFPDWREPERDDEDAWRQIYQEWNYLAQRIFNACEAVLEKPAETMKYIRTLAKHCMEYDRILEWISPSGCPVSNRCHEPDVHEVPMKRLADPEKDLMVRVRHRIGDGFKPELEKRKILDAAAPKIGRA